MGRYSKDGGNLADNRGRATRLDVSPFEARIESDLSNFHGASQTKTAAEFAAVSHHECSADQSPGHFGFVHGRIVHT
jgi:hypothetical protein